jgi:hypothetical protein
MMEAALLHLYFERGLMAQDDVTVTVKLLTDLLCAMD